MKPRHASDRPAPRIGLFGLLGSGNFGNDGSLAAMLAFLRTERPDAVVDALCGGAEVVTARYGLAATPLHWYRAEYRTAARPLAIMAKALGKFVDAVRIARWTRGHDIVLVPGMGILEATLPLRPWGFPYALLLLCLSGRLFGRKVALVGVGADTISHRVTRVLLRTSGKLAAYRSYRDTLSRDAMREMGVDTAHDPVHPDLAFALPTPASHPGDDTTIVGVGVMAYHGGNDDRAQAERLHRRYVARMARFVCWLVDGGHEVRLFTGDRQDEPVVDTIIDEVRAERPLLRPAALAAASVSSLEDLLDKMSTVDAVVATRYHNVLCALKLGKPTVSVGYAAKNDVLMADMGLAEFCQSARDLDVDLLIDQFRTLRQRSPELRETLAEHNVTNERLLAEHLAKLAHELFGTETPSREAVRTS